MADIEFREPRRLDFTRTQIYNQLTRLKVRFSLDSGVVGSQNKYPARCSPFDPAPIIMPSLYLGSAFGSRDIKVLNFYGITHVLNMTHNIPVDLFNLRLITKQIFARDRKDYNLRQHFEEAHEFIDGAMLSGGRVLVHCAVGISRSATIVISYLMARYGMTLNEAYAYVQERRPRIKPNIGFILQLIRYEQELNEARAMYYNSLLPVHLTQ